MQTPFFDGRSSGPLAWLALAELAGRGRPGTRGTAGWLSLAAALGGAEAVFEATTAQLRDAGLAEAGRRALGLFGGWESLRRRLRRCSGLGISIVTVDGDGYPPLLRQIPDPPLALYCLGDPPARAQPAVAMVGTRPPSWPLPGSRW
ncbi:MAG: DNA-processing protein DprA [Deltaproteobacteria bacterium]